MVTRSLGVAAVVLWFFILPTSAVFGSTFLPMSVSELTTASDAILEGEVVYVKSSWNSERTMIFTEAEVEVDRVHRGQAGRTVVVRTPGGTVGEYTVWADGFPTFAEGESVLLFLSTETGAFRVTGHQFGHYRLQPDARGRMMALPTVGEPADLQRSGDLRPLARPLEELRGAIQDPSREPSMRGRAEPFVLLSPARTWPSAPTYIVDSRGLPSINDGDGGVTRTINALTSNQAWNGAGSGTVVSAVSGSMATFALGDGIPMLNFRDPFNVCTGNCLAGTFTGFFTSGTCIYDADIVFNAAVDWTSEGEDPGGAGCSAEFYLESIAVHELGHALGLGHTDVSGATMFPSFSACSNDQATIQADDASGLNALYSGAIGTCTDPTKVSRGIDLWTTPDDGSSVLEVTFPEGFFCKGTSEWFQRSISLRGHPIATSPADVLGNTDTVIERLADATFDSGVANARLVIRALSLRSSNPIAVDCPDQTREDWDMFVSLHGSQAEGSITITRDPNGEEGVFDAVVPVSAQLNFVNVVTGKTVGPLVDSQTFASEDQPWRSEPGPGGVTYTASVQVDSNQDGLPDLTVPGTSNFSPGWKRDVVLGIIPWPLPHPPHIPLPPLVWCVTSSPSALTTSTPCAQR